MKNWLPVQHEDLDWESFFSRLAEKKYHRHHLLDEQFDCLDLWLWTNPREETSIVHYLDEDMALLVNPVYQILGFHIENYHLIFQTKYPDFQQAWKLQERCPLKKITQDRDLWLAYNSFSKLDFWLVLPRKSFNYQVAWQPI